MRFAAKCFGIGQIESVYYVGSGVNCLTAQIVASTAIGFRQMRSVGEGRFWIGAPHTTAVQKFFSVGKRNEREAANTVDAADAWASAHVPLISQGVTATRCRFLYEVVSLDVGGETTRTTG
jgi:hypothetical protein